MFFFGQQIKQARKLIRKGELNVACQLARQANFPRSPFGRRVANQLIDQLVDRAGRSSVCGDLESAWRDLGDASTITTDKNTDRISREKNQLVDRTIKQAHSLLNAGKPSNAESMISLLKKRKILDRRADELQNICNMISSADKLAAEGRLNDATSLLQQTKQLRPDLSFLDSRIRNYGYQQSQLADLTSELRFAINESAWGGACDVTQRMLQIAPQNKIALDARRRANQRIGRSDGRPDHQVAEKQATWRIDDTSIPGSHNNSVGDDRLSTDITSNKSTCYDQSTSSSELNSSQEITEQAIGSAVDASSPSVESGSNDFKSGPMNTFMLWVDGVGGYLVCTGSQVTIGRAVPNPGIEIPVQADIRRHHMRIKRANDGYLAQSLNGVEVEPAKDGDWLVLEDQQKLELGQGVQARFSISHPLGRSARVEFTSRHRTEPWSDAVILLGDAILMGPDRSSHICCPRWDSQLVVFRNGDEVCLRSPGELEVNGINHIGDVVLKDGVQVVGAGFSISCERVS